MPPSRPYILSNSFTAHNSVISLLRVTRAVDEAFFHKRRVQQIDIGPEIFSTRVYFYFRDPLLCSMVTRGKGLRFNAPVS